MRFGRLAGGMTIWSSLLAVFALRQVLEDKPFLDDQNHVLAAVLEKTDILQGVCGGDNQVSQLSRFYGSQSVRHAKQFGVGLGGRNDGAHGSQNFGFDRQLSALESLGRPDHIRSR